MTFLIRTYQIFLLAKINQVSRFVGFTNLHEMYRKMSLIEIFGSVLTHNFSTSYEPTSDKNINQVKTQMSLTHLSLESFLWDIAAKRGVPSGAILFV